MHNVRTAVHRRDYGLSVDDDLDSWFLLCVKTHLYLVDAAACDPEGEVWLVVDEVFW